MKALIADIVDRQEAALLKAKQSLPFFPEAVIRLEGIAFSAGLCTALAREPSGGQVAVKASSLPRFSHYPELSRVLVRLGCENGGNFALGQ